MLDQAQVIATVQSMASASLDPVLTDPEVGYIVDRFQIAVLWAADTAYNVGDKVYPLNGRCYRCHRAGTSGTTFPCIFDRLYRETVCDGTVHWIDEGPAYPQLWDISGAIGAAWELKATKAAGYFNVKAPGQMFDQEAVFQHCSRMAARYRPTYVK